MNTASASSRADASVRLYAAGSLAVVLSDVAAAFRAETGIVVAGTYGSSGLLRERIEKGEPAELFASANMEHPQMLAQGGRFSPVTLFTRNTICALVHPNVADVTPETLLVRMLDDAVLLGTSTPKSDPSGDYAWQVFRRAEAVRPGSFARLEAKALRLTGASASPPPPAGRNAYGYMVEHGEADIFLTYRTNAVLARREVTSLRQVALPPDLTVSADYGMTVAQAARPEVARFAEFVLSDKGQAIFRAQGFSPIR